MVPLQTFRKNVPLIVVVVACLVASADGRRSGLLQLRAAEPPASADDSAYATRVLPLLRDRCVKCHGDDEKEGSLDLSTREGLLRGGESGEVLIPGKPEDSPLYVAVRDHHMPPASEGERPLSSAQIELIQSWIAAGAKFGNADRATVEISQHEVVPILLLRCTVCHGGRVQEAGLDLRSKASMLKGGKSGPAIVPGDPEASLIIKKIRTEEMPPRRRVVEVSIKPIEPVEVDTLVRWISAGAPESELRSDVATTDPDPLVSDEDRDFWAFKSPRMPAVPVVAQADRVRNPIDAFILQKLEQEGLTLSPEADRQVLLRRLYFDLIGLPPTPEQAEAFLADSDPLAYEKLVDQLLDSPHYGERWGRYWLDLAGYSDSNGVQHSDPVRPHAWRYRDYVIRAFQKDKPYDRFLLEQIAGDELADYERAPELTSELYDNLVATGFLRMTPDGTSANITNFVPDRLEIISDELNVLSSAVMGLTLKCARCHSHKSDPIPQRDYYRLSAVFKGAYDEHDWMKATRKEDARGPWPERILDVALPQERQVWEANERRIADASNELRAKLKTQEDTLREKHLALRLAGLPQSLHQDLRQMLATPADQRNDIQKYLAGKFESSLRIDAEQLKKLAPEYKMLAEETDRKLKGLESERTTKPGIQALWDRGAPSPTYVLVRGDHKKFGREVGPGALSVLTDGKTPFVVSPPWPGALQTGRRLAFARWLVEPSHPLTARVMVNRLWRHHFGAGIVRTLDNFGTTGDRPTHPELLDWLALTFSHQGWSVKQMHRLMVNSSTYRQSSITSETNEAKDPENRLLSHMPLRRVEAEIVRDSLLAVAGRLDNSPFGPPDDVDAKPSGLVLSKGTSRGWRRTIYVQQRRTQTLTILEDFDLPQMLPNCIDRPVSTVAPQALHLMNNDFVHTLAQEFAERVKERAGDQVQSRIDVAWRLALARTPTPEEINLAVGSLNTLAEDWKKQLSTAQQGTPAEMLERSAANQALVNLCHALLNSAEFVTID